MENLDSMFIYQESEQELRQKLADAALELETLKNVKMEMLNMLKMANQERDEARNQLQKLMNKLAPSSPIHLQNVFNGVQHENPLSLPSAKANSSITESNSLSHGSASPPVDSFFDTVSSPELSNINAVDSNNNNMGYLNQHLVQSFKSLAPQTLMVPLEKQMSDRANAVIDSLAKERNLPQKGKLLQAVIDAGPTLKNILLAGPLPTWRNPPPLQDIKVPPLAIKEYDNSTSIEMNAFAGNGNSFINPKLPALQFPNATSTCSASMLTFAGHPPGSWNNALQFSPNSNVGIQVPSRKRLRHQLF